MKKKLCRMALLVMKTTEGATLENCNGVAFIRQQVIVFAAADVVTGMD
jgi:hypothetical protein